MTRRGWLIVGAIIAAGILAAYLAPFEEGGADSRPGSAAVYDRIVSQTGCMELLDEYDQARANNRRETTEGDAAMMAVTRSYMDAADDRMRELGCY